MLDAVFALLEAAWQWCVNWFTWENAKLFGNSAFTTSLIGALAGAFAGAVAAQRVAERSKRREELTKELRNTNAAITLAFSIVNGALAVKKQHVIELKGAYDAEVARHMDFAEK